MNLRVPIAYAVRGIQRPRYHANDASRDQLEIVAVDMDIADARRLGVKLEETGFELLGHRSALADFGDRAGVDAVYRPEIIEFIAGLSGADHVVVNSPGILRFSERSAQS